jgi:hypothetical protein
MNKFCVLVFSLILSFTGYNMLAQEAPTTSVKTLFPYPVAPDTCSTLESRCNFIVAHFWDNYNITKPVTNDSAFEKAFRDYVTFFKFAHKNIVFASIRDFMFKAETNKYNFVKFGEMAERSLYSPTAEYWSDEAYLPFAQAVANAKFVNTNVRNHYKAQIERIQRNQVGSVMTDFEYTDVNGTKKKLSELTSEVFFIFFNDSGSDSSIARLRISTDVTFNDLIAKGKIKIVSISTENYSKEWAENAKTFADNWEIGASGEILKEFDVRSVPSFYILDKDRKIVAKNVGVDDVKNLIQ